MLGLLKLLQHLNAPHKLSREQKVVALEAGDGAGQLILDADLARAILKHPQARPFDLWEYYLTLTRLTADELPCLTGYFGKGPLLQHATEHSATRRALLPFYRRMERAVTEHFDAKLDAFIDGLAMAPERRPDDVAQGFADLLFGLMIAQELGLEAAAVPPSPGSFFTLLPRRETLIAREAELAQYVAVLRMHLARQGRPEEDVWALLTLVLMGHDALKGAVFFALSQPQSVAEVADAEGWMQAIAPVGVLPRQFDGPVDLDGVCFAAGQIAYICPHLVHQVAQSSARGRSFAFGAGAHMCPGRRIAVHALQALIDRKDRIGLNEVSNAPLQWRRDLLLSARQAA